MRRRVDLAIEYEGGTYSTSIHRDENDLPKVGYILLIDIEGKERRVKITEVFPAVIYEGSVRTPVHGAVVDDYRPFVRFHDSKNGLQLDVVQTEETNERYHLLHVGDEVALNGGGKVTIRNVVLLPNEEVIYHCG